MKLSDNESTGVVNFSKCSTMKGLAIIIKELRNGGDFKVLSNDIHSFLVNVVEVGVLNEGHDVDIIDSKGGVTPFVFQLDVGSGFVKEYPEGGKPLIACTRDIRSICQDWFGEAR